MATFGRLTPAGDGGSSFVDLEGIEAIGTDDSGATRLLLGGAVRTVAETPGEIYSAMGPGAARFVEAGADAGLAIRDSRDGEPGETVHLRGLRVRADAVTTMLIADDAVHVTTRFESFWVDPDGAARSLPARLAQLIPMTGFEDAGRNGLATVVNVGAVKSITEVPNPLDGKPWLVAIEVHGSDPIMTPEPIREVLALLAQPLNPTSPAARSLARIQMGLAPGVSFDGLG